MFAASFFFFAAMTTTTTTTTAFPLSSVSRRRTAAYAYYYYYSPRRLFSSKRMRRPLTDQLLLRMRGGGGGGEGDDDDTDTAAAAHQQEEARRAPSQPHFKFYTLENGMCPYAARTWMTLLELGLSFDTVEVNALKKEPLFLALNPRGKVPVIQNMLDNTTVYESSICNEYLCEVARDISSKTTSSALPTPSADDEGAWKLMPMTPKDRAALRLLNDHVDNKLNPAVYTFLMNKDSEQEPKLIDELENALTVLQDSLVSRGGPYLMGKDFSLADIHVLPFFLRMKVALKHFKGYDLSSRRDKFGPLLDWYDRCSQRDSVQRTSKSDEVINQVYRRFIEANYAFGGLNKNKK